MPEAPAGITHIPDLQTPLAQSGPVVQVVFGSGTVGMQYPPVHLPLWQSLAWAQCEPAVGSEIAPPLEPPEVEPPAPVKPPSDVEPPGPTSVPMLTEELPPQLELLMARRNSALAAVRVGVSLMLAGSFLGRTRYDSECGLARILLIALTALE
jgi:hypothetical protein